MLPALVKCEFMKYRKPKHNHIISFLLMLVLYVLYTNLWSNIQTLNWKDATINFLHFFLKISVLLMCRLAIMNIPVHLILINNLPETPDACGLLIIKMPFMFTNSLLISDNELLRNSVKSSKRSSHGPICLICKVCQPCLFCLICYFHILICNT